ncbi:hypothetical protein [Lysobacter sp. GCM10012299]|uniref:hypothetical protein n=1 Tax=Lysobacter sp. GCM10012299 TaxID=3317333 RepID=UPI003611221D
MGYLIAMSYFQLQTEPRSRTMLRHTRQAVSDRALNVLAFSERVADRYLSAVAPEDRVVGLKEQGDTMATALAAKKHNGIVVDRLIKGVVKTFPADLEDAWVGELPQPYRQRCEQDLAARRGLLPVKDPRASTAPAQQGGELSALLTEVGDVAAALAPIFADGKVDAGDMPYIAHALRQLGELFTVGLQLHQRLTNVAVEEKGATPSVAPLRRV